MTQNIELPLHPEMFDYESGNLALDFANTVSWHSSDHPEEYLTSYLDLIAWGLGANLISASEAQVLARLPDSLPQEAEHWYRQAIVLRDAVYRTFAAISLGQAVVQSDLDELAGFWRQAVQSMRITAKNGAFAWEWTIETLRPQCIVWPVVRAAIELLESDQLYRVGQCEDDRGCGYIFLDTSRNRSRRWCSMESCGNRAKAHRHYTRSKK